MASRAHRRPADDSPLPHHGGTAKAALRAIKAAWANLRRLLEDAGYAVVKMQA